MALPEIERPELADANDVGKATIVQVDKGPICLFIHDGGHQCWSQRVRNMIYQTVPEIERPELADTYNVGKATNVQVDKGPICLFIQDGGHQCWSQ